MDFTLQKAVELGVSVVTPLITARCNVKLMRERFEKKHRHWHAENSAEQTCDHDFSALGECSGRKGY